MAVPGMKAKVEIRAKVRIGEKSGRGARSVDFFQSTDPELADLFGSRPSTIRIRFPHASVEDAFSTGLEWWSKRKSDQKNQLACYTKGAEENGKVVALRMEAYASEGDEVLGPKRGVGRLPIACPSRECPIQKRGDCKPMGRLVFFLDGGRTDQALELDTKSWNSIESLEPALAAAGDLRGRVWDLTVQFQSKGNKRFPVLSIQEVSVEVNTPEDVEQVEGLLALERAIEAGKPPREQLADALDVASPGWREKPEIIAKIKEVGVDAAIAGFRRKFA